MRTIKIVNDIGLGIFEDDPKIRLQSLRVYVEHGSVQLWVETTTDALTTEVLAYLSPTEAMSLSKAFERCAIEAFKAGAL